MDALLLFALLHDSLHFHLLPHSHRQLDVLDLQLVLEVQVLTLVQLYLLFVHQDLFLEGVDILLVVLLFDHLLLLESLETGVEFLVLKLECL